MIADNTTYDKLLEALKPYACCGAPSLCGARCQDDEISQVLARAYELVSDQVQGRRKGRMAQIRWSKTWWWVQWAEGEISGTGIDFSEVMKRIQGTAYVSMIKEFPQRGKRRKH